MEDMNIAPELKKAFKDMGFSKLTEIQEKAIPLILEGKDVIGQSMTGSGKTAAFGFPSIEKVKPKKGIQVMVLVPTRELAEQVTTEMRKFSKHKKLKIIQVYGGVSINPQIFALEHADIVVATPGRTLDHVQRGTINLKKVNTFILDEADKMFEMGFVDDVKKIASQIPKERQTLLFSATMSTQVQDIVKHYMKHPVKIKVQSYVEKGKMTQQFYSVDNKDKFSLLVHLIKHEKPGLAIVFCATRNRVDVLSKNLYKQGINSDKLHGGLTQNRRKQAIDAFHGNKVDVLVASDVAARGLDIKNVSHVFNYDSPKTSKEYIHRIGRTARAGSEGKVITLIAEPDHDNFRCVLDDRSIKIDQMEIPDFKRVPFIAGMSGGGRGFQRGSHSFRGGPRGRSSGGYGSRRPSARPSYSGGRSSRYGNRPGSSNDRSSSSGERSSYSGNRQPRTWSRPHGSGDRSHSGSSNSSRSSGHRFGSR
jgi:superfamily II DNA/RNA helicase